mgnify:CR=1 FL=1
MLISKENCNYANYSKEITLIKECRKEDNCKDCPFSDGKDFVDCPSYHLFYRLRDMIKGHNFYSEKVLYEEIDF